MSITEEEKEDIILEVIERILVKMPSVIGNLMARHASINKEKKKFFEDNKDFKNYKDIVGSVIENIEGNDLSKKPEDIYAEAVPEIKKRIALLNKLDITNITEPNTTIKNIDNNGLI